MKYSDRQRVQKIYDYAVRLQEYILENRIEKEVLLTQLPLQWLVTTPLYNMGEHCHNLSAEYKVKHGEIPWAMIAGLRHRLVHDYDGTNWNIISEVVFEELPILIEQLRVCLTENENTDDVR
jgi:putative toxin-antitoxin system, antitoxin component